MTTGANIEFKFFGRVAGNGNNKRTKFKVGDVGSPTTRYDTTSFAAAANDKCVIEGEIMRQGGPGPTDDYYVYVELKLGASFTPSKDDRGVRRWRMVILHTKEVQITGQGGADNDGVLYFGEVMKSMTAALPFCLGPLTRFKLF